MADEHIPPEKELASLFSSYPGLVAEAPSSWFVWSDNTGLPPKLRLNSVCHADMRFHTIGYDHLVTACPKSDLLSIKYIRMLIHGPFRAFSDLISLKKHKAYYYIQVDGLDKWPANVLFNFCIASRVPIEYPHLFEHWDELAKAGYPEVFAFLLSYSTDGAPFKKQRSYPNQNHLWLDPAADWKNILSGTPDLTCKTFKDNPTHVLPTNQIWGKSDAHYKVSTLPDNKVAEYFDIKIAQKPEPRKRLTPEVQFKKYQYDVEAMNGGVHPVGQAIHDEVAIAAAAPAPQGGQLAAHWAQIIAQQEGAMAQQNHNFINMIPAQAVEAQPPQPPQPHDWDIDEDDFPDFDDDD